MQKCYNITVTGKVQDIGFRSVVEYAGRLLELNGLVFNAKNGSVRILCCGEDDIIGDFFHEIRTRGEQRGAVIRDIKKQEMPFIDLPEMFSRLFTDDDIDIGRKLDKGNDLLTDIKADTAVLSSFVIEQREHNKEQREHNKKQREHNKRLDDHNQWMKEHLVKMDDHNQWMKEHNQRLEKILEKLAEK